MWDIRVEILLDHIRASELQLLLLQVLEMSDLINLSVKIMVKDIREIVDWMTEPVSNVGPWIIL